MKRRRIAAPYRMDKNIGGQFGGLVKELANINRVNFTTPEVWRLACVAEMQYHLRRRTLPAEDLEALKRYRVQFGLPELPPKPAR